MWCIQLMERDLVGRPERTTSAADRNEYRCEEDTLQGTLPRTGETPFAAYRTPPGRLPTIPSATNRTESAKAGALSTPARAKNHTNAAWLVPRPLTVTGSNMTRRMIGTNAK